MGSAYPYECDLMYEFKINGDLEVAAEMLEHFMDQCDAMAITCDPKDVSDLREGEDALRITANLVRASIEFNKDFQHLSDRDDVDAGLVSVASVLQQLESHLEALEVTDVVMSDLGAVQRSMRVLSGVQDRRRQRSAFQMS